MMEFQERVVAEKKELDAKLEKLDAFLKTKAFNKVDQVEKGRLRGQRAAMTTYSTILGERIEAFRK